MSDLATTMQKLAVLEKLVDGLVSDRAMLLEALRDLMEMAAPCLPCVSGATELSLHLALEDAAHVLDQLSIPQCFQLKAERRP